MTPISRRRLRYTLVGCTAAALTLSGSLTTPASAGTPEKAADEASSWLAGELTGNVIPFPGGDFVNWGLTIDVAFAMAAADNSPARLAKVVTKIEGGVAEYISWNGEDISANAAAKALTAAVVLGEDPATFGGQDLRQGLLDLVVSGEGFEAGRVRDVGESDYSNTFGQSFAVLGLTRSGAAPQSTVDYLLKQQCADGYFRLYMSEGQTCDDSANDDSENTDGAADVDATAMAIQGLVAAKADGLAVPSAQYKLAVTWLRSMQDDDGGFGSGPSIPVENSNSTALAGAALAAAGKAPALKKAQKWVLTMQLTKADIGKKNAGAIAYSKKTFKQAKMNGIGSAARDQFHRSTTQGAVALAGTSLVSLKSR